MATPIQDHQDPESQVPPGSGYIPPETALLSTGGSATAGGFAAGIPLLFMTLAQLSLAGPAGDTVKPVGYAVGKVPLHNVPLAAALTVAAVVLAGLALAFTALAGREPGYGVNTRLAWLKAYVILGVVGLAAYSLGLDFLARQLPGSYHVSMLFGTLFQILALAAGLYARYPAEEKDKATERPMRRSPVVE